MKLRAFPRKGRFIIDWDEPVVPGKPDPIRYVPGYGGVAFYRTGPAGNIVEERWVPTGLLAQVFVLRNDDE